MTSVSIIRTFAALWLAILPLAQPTPDTDTVVGASEAPTVEPHIAVNPRNGAHRLIGAFEVGGTTDHLETTCVSYVTFDGGAHWQRHEFSVKQCVDPWTDILDDGSAVMAMLGNSVEDAANNLRLVRSTDGGRTWSDPLFFGELHDHPTIVARGHTVYLVSSEGVRRPGQAYRYSVFVTRSDDGGRTFPVRSRTIASNLAYDTESATVLPDESVLVAFGDYRRINQLKNRLQRPREWLVRSSDRGASFSEPMFLSESCDDRGGWPSLTSDAHGVALWLCAADGSKGALIQRSTDEGETWSESVRLAATEKADAHNPAVAIAPDGSVGVTWLERDADRCLALYGSVSRDGAKTFGAPVALSSGRSCPQANSRNAIASSRWPAGGDYMGLAALPAGFVAVWADARDGVFHLRQKSFTF